MYYALTFEIFAGHPIKAGLICFQEEYHVRLLVWQANNLAITTRGIYFLKCYALLKKSNQRLS